MCSFLEDLETRAFCSFADAECQVVQEGNEVSVFDDEELGVQVIELLGKRCSVAFPCSSILRHLCLHVKVTQSRDPCSLFHGSAIATDS